MTDLSVQIGNITLKNPILTASGTFGYGTEVDNIIDVSKLGGIVTKSISLNPREGNPPPRIVETPSGMLNSIGLANIGVDKYIKEKIPLYSKIGTSIIMNIAGSSINEYVEIVKRVESVSSDIVAYEVNISCPNVSRGGMQFGVDCELTYKLTEKLRSITERPLIIKLTPNVTDIAAIAQSAEEGGADAISAINTVVGMSIDIHTRKSHISTKYSGLSGPAIRPIGIASVYKIFKSVNIPVIGIGGITNSEDIIEYILAGSLAVQIGTSNFRDPGISVSILEDLVSYLEQNNYSTLGNLVGGVL
ncbi:MAG: dihydroorotate dehydrogenase [Candidatus Marinimicrobia bacterium]|nr:dihydroorotate dehydrogenase [Candidatus Neomarinimicrobiota bacterium]HJM47902.1 dihydroorotate dehydrogenase [Candidatus Neomarinimicrobiota bacterium]